MNLLGQMALPIYQGTWQHTRCPGQQLPIRESREEHKCQSIFQCQHWRLFDWRLSIASTIYLSKFVRRLKHNINITSMRHVQRTWEGTDERMTYDYDQ